MKFIIILMCVMLLGVKTQNPNDYWAEGEEHFTEETTPNITTTTSTTSTSNEIEISTEKPDDGSIAHHDSLKEEHEDETDEKKDKTGFEKIDDAFIEEINKKLNHLTTTAINKVTEDSTSVTTGASTNKPENVEDIFKKVSKSAKNIFNVVKDEIRNFENSSSKMVSNSGMVWVLAIVYFFI